MIETPENNHLNIEAREHLTEFMAACGAGVLIDLAEIENKFERSKTDSDNLQFHNREHTNHVIEMTNKILSLLRKSDEARASVTSSNTPRSWIAYPSPSQPDSVSGHADA